MFIYSIGCLMIVRNFDGSASRALIIVPDARRTVYHCLTGSGTGQAAAKVGLG
jgi:hypothetical protein